VTNKFFSGGEAKWGAKNNWGGAFAPALPPPPWRRHCFQINYQHCQWFSWYNDHFLHFFVQDCKISSEKDYYI
jgi:hypothetical protein